MDTSSARMYVLRDWRDSLQTRSSDRKDPYILNLSVFSVFANAAQGNEPRTRNTWVRE